MMDREISQKHLTSENKPTMTVFAGTNGAGKSELTNILKHQNPEVEIIDADAIARKMNPKNPAKANIEAGRETIRRVKECIEKKRDFSIETTLGGRNVLRQMEMAKKAGFHINLYYVGLANVELHIDRVAQRVSKGGHDIPEADIRRRYESSMKNLPTAMRLAHHSFIFDNTEVYKIKLEAENGLTRYQDPNLPNWVKDVVKEWHSEQSRIVQDLNQEKNQLSKEVHDTREKLKEAQEALKPVQEKERLLRLYASYVARYEALKPTTFIERLLQPNRTEIKQIENELGTLSEKIEHWNQQLPSSLIESQQNVSSLSAKMDQLLKHGEHIGIRSLEIQNQIMSRNIQRNFEHVQHVMIGQSPALER
jgi:predicted ABC-type ATPase/predicted  nucleic acid-binding Zn-ribbon protein